MPSSTPSIIQTIDSTDLCVGLEECALLHETFDTDLPSMDSDGSVHDVPPFPSGCISPISTVIELGVHLAMFPKGLTRFGGGKRVEESSLPIITIPTPPRLKTMLKERLRVRKWAESIVVADAPGHLPWVDARPIPSYTWIPEGSILPPEEFKAALSVRRHARSLTTVRSFSENPPKDFTRASNSLSNRGASPESLVFQREFTRNTDGKHERYSLQVPASTMNPEMVNMMLQLQDLSSFFRGGPHGLGASESSFHPPILTVSNSEITLPISIESTPKVPNVLAIRRGKQAPPALSLKNDVADYPYPDIPTAFLGSPSTYSPQFEFANHSDQPPMGLDDMVTSLRTRCASIGGYVSPIVSTFESQSSSHQPSPLSATPTGCNTATEGDEDEWAFANGLVQSYGDSAFSPDTLRWIQRTPHADRRSSLPASQPDSPLAFGSESSTCGPGLGIRDKSDGFIATNTPSGPAKRRYTTPVGSLPSTPLPIVSPPKQSTNTGKGLNIGRPPSTPLPSHPGIAGVSTPLVRGILKSAKSVRFASLPVDNASPTTAANTPSRRPRPALRAKQSLKPPSPLRQTFSPNADIRKPRATSVTPSGTPAKPPSTRTPVRRSLAPEVLVNVPVVTVAPKDRRATVSHPPRPSNMTPTANDVTPRKTVRKAASSLGRYSFGFKNEAGKENKARITSTPLKGSRFSTVDENALRRAKDAMGAQKSRMSTPLRNIFTRFK